MQSDYDFEQGGFVEGERNEIEAGKTVVDSSLSVDLNLPFESTLTAMIQDQLHSEYDFSDSKSLIGEKIESDFDPSHSQVKMEESPFSYPLPSRQTIHSFSESKYYSSSVSEISYQIDLSPREENEQQVQDRSYTTISYSRSSDYYLSSENNDTHDHSGHSLDTLQEINISKSHQIPVHTSITSDQLGDGIGSSELYERRLNPEALAVNDNTSSLIFNQQEGKAPNVLSPSAERSLPLPPPPTTGFYSSNVNKPASPPEYPTTTAHYSPPPHQLQRFYNPYLTQPQPQPQLLALFQPPETMPQSRSEPTTFSETPSDYNQSPSSYAEYVSPQQSTQLVQNNNFSPLTNESDENRHPTVYENSKQPNENVDYNYNYDNYPQQYEETQYNAESNYYDSGINNSNQVEGEVNSEVPYETNYYQNNPDDNYMNQDFRSPTNNETASTQTNYYSANSSDYPITQEPNYSHAANQVYQIHEDQTNSPRQFSGYSLSSSIQSSNTHYKQSNNQQFYSQDRVTQNLRNEHQDYYSNQQQTSPRKQARSQSEYDYQAQESNLQQYDSSYDYYYAEEQRLDQQSNAYVQNYISYDNSSSAQPQTQVNDEREQSELYEHYGEENDQYNQYYSNSNSYEHQGEEAYRQQYTSDSQNYNNADSTNYYDNESYYKQQEGFSKDDTRPVNEEYNNYYSSYQASEYESQNQWDYSDQSTYNQSNVTNQEQLQYSYDYDQSEANPEQSEEYQSYDYNTTSYNNSNYSTLNQNYNQRPLIAATINPVNPDISSDSDEDTQRKLAPKIGKSKDKSNNVAEQYNQPNSNISSLKQSFRNQDQEQSRQSISSGYDAYSQSTIEPNQSTTSLSPTPVSDVKEQSDAEKKLRHLQIWERFFENAAKMSDNEGTSSDTNNNPKNRLKMSLLRLSHEKNAANWQNEDTLTDGYPARPNLSFQEGTISPTSSDDPFPPPGSPSLGNQIDFNSSISKQYFTFAIAADQSWPVLISSKKYQTLLALAKASIGTVNNRLIIPYMGLFAAVIMEDMENVNYFLMRGINPNCRDQVRRTVVHHVARVGNEKILALLFDSSAELDVIDQVQQFTPLHIAVIFNRLSIVRFLLDSAVDVSRRTSSGLTALDLARQWRHTECEKLIIDFMQYSSIYSFDQLASMNDQMNNYDVRKDSLKGLVSDSDSSQQRSNTTPPPTKPPVAKRASGDSKQRGKSVTPIVLSSSGSGIPDVNPEAINFSSTETYSYQAQLNYTRSNVPPSNSHQSQLLPIEEKISKRKKSSSLLPTPDNLTSTSDDQPQTSSGGGRKVSFDLNKFKQKEKEILEKRKELEKKVEKTKLSLSLQPPNENNSDDDYVPSDPTVISTSLNTAQSFNTPTPQVRHIPQKSNQQQDEEGEEEDQEDTADEEQEESTLSLISKLLDRFSASIWSIAVSILSLTLFLLMNKSSKTNDNGGKKKNSRNRKQSEEEEVLQLIGGNGSRGNTPTAPPTDEELFKKGITVGTVTISPTGSQVRAPHDVQLAIAMSKVGKKLVGSPVASSKEHLETVETVKKEIANRYSLGSSLPQGTSWRYVNVMDLNSKKNQ
eukprot:gene12213-13353_t